MKQHQIALVIQTEKGIRLTKVFIPFKKGDKDQHIIFENKKITGKVMLDTKEIK